MPAQEVIDLSKKDQRRLWEEVSLVCRAVRSSFAPGLKLNIAAIGNVVRIMLPVCPQLSLRMPPVWVYSEGLHGASTKAAGCLTAVQSRVPHCDRVSIMYGITGGSAARACHAAKPRGSFMAGALLWSCAAQAIHPTGAGRYANKAETSHTMRTSSVCGGE